MSSSSWDDPEASIDEDNTFQQQEQNKKIVFHFRGKAKRWTRE